MDWQPFTNTMNTSATQLHVDIKGHLQIIMTKIMISFKNKDTSTVYDNLYKLKYWIEIITVIMKWAIFWTVDKDMKVCMIFAAEWTT